MGMSEMLFLQSDLRVPNPSPAFPQVFHDYDCQLEGMRFLKGRTGQMTGSHGNLGPGSRVLEMMPFAGASKQKAGGGGERQEHGGSDSIFCLCLYLPSV